MNDEKLYEAGGYADFETYTEQALGIKKSQAYKYIRALEKGGEEIFHSNGNLGITKISLLGELTQEEREELAKSTDIETATVKELRAQIEELRGEVQEKENKINELEWNAEVGQFEMEANSTRVENSEELAAARAEAERAKEEAETAKKEALAKQEEVSRARLDATKLRGELAKLTDEKNALAEKLKKPAVQTVADPATEAERDKAVAALREKEAEIERLNKKLKVADNTALTEFKFQFGEFQIRLSAVVDCLSTLDEENRGKCRMALRKVIEGAAI